MSGDVVNPVEWPALPGPAVWGRLGVRDLDELSGGHQSRVFAARLGRDAVAIKLTDARHVDRARFDAHTALVNEIASNSPLAVGPLRIRGEFVNRLGDWFAVVSPLVEGPPPDVEAAGQVALMGRTLAELHRVMAALPAEGIAPVAALEVAPGETGELPVQLLHGDFSAANVRLHAGEPKVFDFDECGTGPVQFDVANTLYMVLFDATVTGDPGRYQRFREWFVDAYGSAADASLDEGLLDRLIELRRDALRYWIDHLHDAPAGIRTSSADWLATLRRFSDRVT